MNTLVINVVLNLLAITRFPFHWVFCTLCIFGATGVRADIVIAQVSPQQGFLSFYTTQLTLGAQAYFQAINSRGGVDGQRIRLIVEDDGADPERTVALYESIAAKYAPVAFLYQVGPAAIVRLLEKGTLDRLHIPLLGTLPAIDSFRRPVRPYIFHLRRGDEFEITKIARHLATIGNRRVAVIYYGDAAGEGAVPVVKRELSSVGGSLVFEGRVEVNKPITEAILHKLGEANAQAAIMFMPAEATGATVAALRQRGIELPLYSVSYLDPASLVQSAGSRYARGVAISQAFPNPRSHQMPLMAEFRRDMAAMPPDQRKISPFTLEGYIAARVLVEAVRAAGGSKATGKAVQSALERLRFDMGGLAVNFQPSTHVGLDFVDIGVVDEAGRLLY
jgi:branched-chain amino acid transport system substrate-binding protein